MNKGCILVGHLFATPANRKVHEILVPRRQRTKRDSMPCIVALCRLRRFPGLLACANASLGTIEKFSPGIRRHHEEESFSAPAVPLRVVAGRWLWERGRLNTSTSSRTGA